MRIDDTGIYFETDKEQTEYETKELLYSIRYPLISFASFGLIMLIIQLINM